MSNMSHARFQNTLSDLRDCYEHMWDDDLSHDESRARRRLINLACEIAADFADEDD